MVIKKYKENVLSNLKNDQNNGQPIIRNEQKKRIQVKKAKKLKTNRRRHGFLF